MAKKAKEIPDIMDFNYTELTALCEHLQQKEREGLRFKGFERNMMVFEPSEEREIRYSAVIHTTTFLLKKDFIAACEHEGWEYVDTYKDDLFIFRTEKDDAEEIITDEKENFRTVVKSFLFHPGFLGVSAWFFIALTRVLTHSLSDLIPPLANVGLIMWITALATTAHPILTSIYDFIKWYIKAKKAVSNGDRIPFLNLSQKKKKKKENSIVEAIIGIIAAMIFAFVFFGYTSYDSVFSVYFILIIIVIEAFCFAELIYSRMKKEEKKAKELTRSFLSLAAMAVALSGIYFCSETAYKNNAEIITNRYEIPVTLSDLGFDDTDCINETEACETTRLGQFYWFSSELNSDGWVNIDYYIFKSDIPVAIKQYIKSIEENDVLAKDETKSYQWDAVYRYVAGDRHSFLEEGYAVKGNTVVWLRWSSYEEKSETDFFDVAYDKLFG
ncbi:MAG: DUF2812 domain-containing protein [Clostridia bacterium]|nr:DUF2812 domain-containing protein [Clostridia bacterium]